MAAPATIITKPAAQAPRSNRMTLASVTRGKIEGPYRILIHGVDGVGKTTFGADAPDPIFLGTEDGTSELDVARFPTPKDWDDLKDAISTLTADAGGFRTLVIDSLDWAEPLLHTKLMAEDGKASVIEEIAGGYGKWVGVVVDQWRIFLAALEGLQRKQGMNVVLIAHSFIKQFSNPEGEDYSRYVLKLADKSGALCREWCKGVYFAQYETFAVKEKGKKVKGVSTGSRLLYTQRTAAFDAKDRYGLPESLPLSWDSFDEAARKGAFDLEALTAEAQRKAELMGGEVKAKVLALLKDHAGDVVALKKINSKLNAKLAEKAQQEEG
jgi:hypothetical protein